MEIKDIFKQPVAIIKLNENLNELLKYCLSIKKTQKGRKLSNSGGFQSNNIDLKTSNISSLIEKINLNSNTFLKKVFLSKHNISVINLWININEYKDYNILHEHPNSILSGVFYVKAPENSGSIVFKNDSDIRYYMNYELTDDLNNYNASMWSFPALENNLYLFPSWLKHYVEPNLSNESRVSISFNLN
jgi:uncharacterized protein (TIGR02466 family)